MAVTFPSNPTDGQIFYTNFRKYVYDAGGETWVQQQYTKQDLIDETITGVSDGAPAALDTLNELAAAIGDDPDMLNTVDTVARRADYDSNPIAANYTLLLADEGKLKTATNATGITITVPDNSGFAVGAQVYVAKLGAGDITVEGAVGITVTGVSDALVFSGKVIITFVKTSATTWLAISEQPKDANTAKFYYGTDTFTTGLTHQVTDSRITANTFITVVPTGEPAGTWSVESAAGSFTITSDTSETSVAFEWNGVGN